MSSDRHYYPDEPHKNAIIERVHRTIARLLQLFRLGSKRFDWYNFLPDVVNNYNTTYHRTTKHTPTEIFA